MKGKTRPVNIHALLGTPDEAESPAFRALTVKHLYEGRLDAFRADPPPPGWDGVFTATST